MKTPCPIENLIDYVPHRAPMIWVDEIIDAEAVSCTARLTIKSAGLYLESGLLRPSSCLEFIAQAYGYGSACHKLKAHGEAKPARRAFLASFKDVHFAHPEAFRDKVGKTLEIRVSGVRQIAAITSLRGQVLDGDQVLCQANLKIFISSE